MSAQEEDIERKKDMNQRRALVYFKKKTKVHISMGGTFYNGMIAEEPEGDFFFLEDQRLGRILIFYSELTKPLGEYRSVG